MHAGVTFFALAALAGPACAQSFDPVVAPATTHWLCGLSQDLVRLVCVADPGAAAPGAPAAQTAMVKGTRFPLDPRRQYTVDLWSPPTEGERVEYLARATICYRSPDCQVTVTLPVELLAVRR